LNALAINVSYVRTSLKVTGLNGAQDLLAFKIIIQALFFVKVINLIRNKVMAFEVVDRELAELLVGEAFVAFGTGIVEKQAAELDFEPCWGERVTVHLNDYLCDSGGDDACILLTGQVHSLVFELRELLVEFLYGQVVKLGYSIVTVWLIGSFCESDFTGTLNEEKIGLLVPIKRVYSEVFGASDKDKGTLRIKCTVEA
jgi:hypothetical protein